jgi:hypothetical protein
MPEVFVFHLNKSRLQRIIWLDARNLTWEEVIPAVNSCLASISIMYDQ